MYFPSFIEHLACARLYTHVIPNLKRKTRCKAFISNAHFADKEA